MPRKDLPNLNRNKVMQNPSVAILLPRILPRVKNPGRYLGGETNQIVKDPASLLASIALIFPDVYEIGMSHNGT